MASSGDARRTGGAAYEEVWPSLAPRLDAALRLRGVQSALRDDVIQETAARLWERWDQVDTASDPFPLAFTIARNLVTDRARERETYQLQEAFDRPSGDDPAETAASRIELRRVMRAVMSLHPRYRDVLLSEAGWATAAGTEPGGVVTNMARMRARRRLRAVLEQAGAVVVLPIRRLRARASDWGTTTRLQFAQAFSGCALDVVVACILTLIGTGVGASLDDDPASVRPLQRTRLVSDVDARDSHRTAQEPRLSSGAPGARGVQADRGGPGGKQAGSDVRLGPLAVPYKGEGHESGSFGAWGYHFEGEGKAAVGEDDLTWKHENDYQNPRCIGRLDEGEVSTDCSGGQPPRGSVEVGYGDRTYRVQYGH